MGTLRALAIAGLLAGGLAAPADAADMLYPPPLRGVSQPAVVELGTGWYLRGDLGYVDYERFGGGRNRDLNRTFDLSKPERTWSLGAGFGYQLTHAFRADVTVDHRFGSDFESLNSWTDFVDDSRREWGMFESTSALVNGYVDLSSWHGFTPYVGAGVGGAMNRLQGYQVQVTCLTLACGPLGEQAEVSVRSRTTTDLAWAVMGGVAVDLLGGFTLDAGYRYINLGRAEIRHASDETAARTKDIDAHELRVGLRYMID